MNQLKRKLQYTIYQHLLKGHSQLAQMRIRYRYHFIPNLHATEMWFILFLTRYDKNNIIGCAKGHLKTGFSVNDENQAKHCEHWNEFLYEL